MNNIVITVKGRSLLLDKNDFVCRSGEGDIWSFNGLSYKIYRNPEKMIQVSKIHDLAKVLSENVFCPIDIVCDKTYKTIGYSIKPLPPVFPLALLFSNAHKQRFGITNDIVMDLVSKMTKRLHSIHSHNILVGDLNAMNFAVLKNLNDTINIDIDAYDTIESDVVSESSDWFGMAALTFQMLIGVHPYKGFHPEMSFSERAKNNVSVLNKDVIMPSNCNSLDILPPTWKDWYYQIFEKGMRLLPPAKSTVIATGFRSRDLGCGEKVKITSQSSFYGKILDVQYRNSEEVVITTQKTCINKHPLNVDHPGRVTGFSRDGTPVIAWLEGKDLKLYNATSMREMKCYVKADEIMQCDGRLYVLYGGNVLCLLLNDIGLNVEVSMQMVATLLPLSSKMYDGIVIQNEIGQISGSIFFSNFGAIHVRLPELDEYTIIDAKYQNKVLMVIGEKNRKYDRLVMRFSQDHKMHDYHVISDVEMRNLNFTVLDNGTCVTITEDGTLEIFYNKPNNKQITTIKDRDIDIDCSLYHNGDTAMITKNNVLYTITVRK